MKQRKKIIFGVLFLTCIGFTSCKVTPAVHEVIAPVEFDLVKEGILYGGGQENIERGLVIVSNLQEWNELKSKMNSVNQVIDTDPINFSTTMIIAYFDKVRGSGGYSVKITNITETSEELAVLYKETSPTGDAIDILTQPYVIVSVPVSLKAIRLKSIE